MYQPRIYPAVIDRLAPIARKKGMTIERMANLYLQLMIAWDELTAKELAADILEQVFVHRIESRLLQPVE
jgi:hypothetical protein